MDKPRAARAKKPIPSDKALSAPDPAELSAGVVGRFRATELEQHIGRRLRFIRRLSGLTLQDVADEIGLSPQQVRKYEFGRNRVSAVLLVEFSGLFSLPMDWFIGPFDPRGLNGADAEDQYYRLSLDQLFRIFQDRDESEAMVALDLITQVSGLAKSQQTPLSRLRSILKFGDTANRESLLATICHFVERRPRSTLPVPSAVLRDEPETEAEGGHRVLLVDDDQDVLSAVSASLLNAGFRVNTAKTGPEALLILDSPLQFDVMVTDQNMIGMDGVELMSQVSERRPMLPTIVITGFGDSERLRDLRPKVEVLVKPFRRMELIGRIRLLIENGSSQRAPPPRSRLRKTNPSRLDPAPKRP